MSSVLANKRLLAELIEEEGDKEGLYIQNMKKYLKKYNLYKIHKKNDIKYNIYSINYFDTPPSNMSSVLANKRLLAELIEEIRYKEGLYIQNMKKYFKKYDLYKMHEKMI